MRDRESDSWWAIMKGEAIGGEREGESLKELPLGEKTTWGLWVAKHPQTKIWAVDGVQYDESKPYANYFTSEGTFRGTEVDDDRLPPKEAVYTFHSGGISFAIPNTEVENGLMAEIPGDEAHRFFFYRQEGLSVFGSTHALHMPSELLRREGNAWVFEDAQGEVRIPDGADLASTQEPLARLTAAEGVRRLGGFDTFWYTWVAVNPDTRLLP